MIGELNRRESHAVERLGRERVLELCRQIAQGDVTAQRFDGAVVARPLLERSAGQVMQRAAFASSARQGSRRLSQRMIQRATFGWTAALEQEVEAEGWEAWLDRQLDSDSSDDGGLERQLEAILPSLRLSPLQRFDRYRDNLALLVIELAVARVYRAIYSPRHVFERVVEFWTDHLHTSIVSDLGLFLKQDYDRDVIRRHALGTFPELLVASARSPAMLDYLTNVTNVKGHPNENYARELMELHTLGVDGGYSETDVKEVARSFTGWGMLGPEDLTPLNFLDFGRFRFRRTRHDTDAKRVLGVNLPAGRGMEDGLDVLALLSSSEATALFVSRKMLRFFWGYEPRQRAVEGLARVYLDTGGDIKSMVRRALSWDHLTDAPVKLKRPSHLVYASMRALYGSINDLTPFLVYLFEAGDYPYLWGPPNGPPDSFGYWSGLPLVRFNYAIEVIGRRLGWQPAVDFEQLAADQSAAGRSASQVVATVFEPHPRWPGRARDRRGPRGAARRERRRDAQLPRALPGLPATLKADTTARGRRGGDSVLPMRFAKPFRQFAPLIRSANPFPRRRRPQS